MAQTSAVRKLVACSAVAVTLAACGARASSGDAAPPSTSVAPGLPNSWSAVIDPKAIPLGDDAVSTKPSKGEIYSCRTDFGGGGPSHGGPWINAAAGTWDATSKVVVRGGNTWPQAVYQERVEGATRVVTTNDLPTQQVTGDFPVAVDDPAHQYDPNPNGISAHEVELRLPAEPKAAAQPGCVPMGAVGILKNGVFLYNGLDATGDDAAAHEAQDVCDGHPDQSHSYHYHNIPSCLLDAVPDEVRPRRLRDLRRARRAREPAHQRRPRRVPRPHEHGRGGRETPSGLPLQRLGRVPVHHRLLPRHSRRGTGPALSAPSGY